MELTIKMKQKTPEKRYFTIYLPEISKEYYLLYCEILEKNKRKNALSFAKFRKALNSGETIKHGPIKFIFNT